ncbi:protease inhibitor I42 family protein [Pseudomonas mangiferae]|uniref:Peptidase inhibitor I42 n=1 Tax=Pseudomonas mangiferae TaxID=2593654 RepID=A0A553H289_9PSED|nr:protease inhibitor I42 family protein [Pseudomonas mangiferae]TRX75874.1 peptidase inhibitor I42 [Pseudomonas mangiferae]
MKPITRALRLAPLTLLAACASQPSGTLLVQQQEDCPLQLARDQVLVLTLPSDPTSGYRWEMREGAANVLHSLGPEVYAAGDDDDGLVGGGGHSTWRFKAAEAGEGHLMLISRRPWETGVAPADMFDCRVEVRP